MNRPLDNGGPRRGPGAAMRPAGLPANPQAFFNPLWARFARLLAIACLTTFAVDVARAEDLLQIYRAATANDPVLASARAAWLANQEAVPQAQAGLLPAVNLVGSATGVDYNTTKIGRAHV